MTEEVNEVEVKETGGVSRREFIWYAWFSSIALFLAGSGGATLAYAYPRFKEGEFGGRFIVGAADEFPPGSVTPIREGKFFLVNIDGEFRALYQVCTHLGCLVRHVEDDGYRCPCHGSQFAMDGTLVASPAPRDMDQFPIEVVDGQVVVDTANRIRGENRSV
jgi:cytochrome b6-f complex iron-sulfur subunit